MSLNPDYEKMSTCAYALGPGQYCPNPPQSGCLRCPTHFGQREAPCWAATEAVESKAELPRLIQPRLTDSTICGHFIARGRYRGLICKQQGRPACPIHDNQETRWVLSAYSALQNEEDVLTWLANQAPEWTNEDIPRIAVAALGAQHNRVFEWLLERNYLHDHEVFDLILSSRLSDTHIQLANRVRDLGFPVVLSNMVLGPHHGPAVVDWAIRHMRKPDLGHQPRSLIRFLDQSHAYGGMKCLLMAQPGHKMTVPDWKRVERHVFYPKLSPSQAEWLPTALGQRLGERKDRIGKALGLVLPPDLVKYVLTRT